jgi:hypothetical protein
VGNSFSANKSSFKLSTLFRKLLNFSGEVLMIAAKFLALLLVSFNYAYANNDAGGPCDPSFKLLAAPPAKVIQLNSWVRKSKPVKQSLNKKERAPEVVGFANVRNAVTIEQFLSHGMISRGNEKLAKYIGEFGTTFAALILSQLKSQGAIGVTVDVTFEQVMEFLKTGVIVDKDGKHPLILKPVYKDHIEWQHHGGASISLAFDLDILSGVASSTAEGDGLKQDVLVAWPLRALLVELPESQQKLRMLAGKHGWPLESLIHGDVTKEMFLGQSSHAKQPLTLKRKLTPFDQYYVINPMTALEFENLNLLNRLIEFKKQKSLSDGPLADTMFWLDLLGTTMTVRLENGEVVTGRMIHFNSFQRTGDIYSGPAVEILTKDHSLIYADFKKVDFLSVEHNPMGMGVGRKEISRHHVKDDIGFERSFTDKVRQPEFQEFRLLPQ